VLRQIHPEDMRVRPSLTLEKAAVVSPPDSEKHEKLAS
jgi:hypothetical protein